MAFLKRSSPSSPYTPLPTTASPTLPNSPAPRRFPLVPSLRRYSKRHGLSILVFLALSAFAYLSFSTATSYTTSTQQPPLSSVPTHDDESSTGIPWPDIPLPDLDDNRPSEDSNLDSLPPLVSDIESDSDTPPLPLPVENTSEPPLPLPVENPPPSSSSSSDPSSSEPPPSSDPDASPPSDSDPPPPPPPEPVPEQAPEPDPLHTDPDVRQIQEWIMAHPEAKLPPTYQAYRMREAKMVPGKEDVGEQGVSVREKFFFPERRVWGLGWGNAVQELLLNALLAWKSGRTFVWDDYLWHYKDTLHFSLYNNKLIPSRVPLSALISGSILGEIYPGQRPLFPRFKSVPRSYFESQRVCGGRVHRINNEEITEAVYREGGIKDVSAGRFLEGWAERLRGVEEECVSNGGSAGQIFDFWIWGGRNIYDLWPILQKSPVLTGFGSSPLVLLAFEANKHLLDLPPSPFIKPFLPKLQLPASPPAQPHDPSSLSSSNPSSDLSLSPPTPHPPISYIPNAFPSSYLASARLSEYTPIPGLLVLHIRRGDFEEHCRNLAGWGVLWQGFNMMVQEGMRDGLGVLWNEEQDGGNSMVGLDHEVVEEEEAARIKAESQSSADVNEEDDMEERARSENEARAGGPFQSPKGRPGSNQVPSSSGKTRSYTGPMLGSPPPLLSHPDREANYLARCYPSVEGIVKRVREVRWEYPRLRRVYVMTNGPGEWVGELKRELMRDSEGHEGVFAEMDREERRRLREKEGKSRDGEEDEEEEEEVERESVEPWEAVYSSRDLVLDWEQKYVAQSVDMAIGARADILIGNGWSSLTAHIVMLRMGHDVENERNRFW